jgi:hypothetical protein
MIIMMITALNARKRVNCFVAILAFELFIGNACQVSLLSIQKSFVLTVTTTIIAKNARRK